MKRLITLFFIFLFSTAFIPASAELLEDQGDIIVNNRVLAQINGKPISVLDVKKKMDIHFLKQYPEYTSIPQARLQYYQINWRPVLQELIDKELILADAENAKINVTQGDLRQELETLFGPNIITNLDEIGMTFDEASKIVLGDITLRRMIGARVHSKASRQVTPQAIRTAYEEFAKQNIKDETYHYQVVTIRNSDTSSGAETARLTFQALNEEKIPLKELTTTMKEKASQMKSNISVSEPFYHSEKEVSDIIKTALKALEPASYSKPIVQKSRTDKGMTYRIIYLIDRVPAGAVPYSEIENQLKDGLFDQAVAKESSAYLKKLHRDFAISDDYIKETIPEEYQPFTLR